MMHNPSVGLNIVDYSRQASMDENMGHLPKDYTQFIVGCGGVGFWVGLFLAMNGCRKFVVMDGQDIENSNLNRLPVPLRWVGMNKARALKRLIRTLRPDCNVMVLPAHVTENTMEMVRQTLLQGCTVVWDCTDDAKIQRKLYRLVRDSVAIYGVSYRKIGYEGFKVGTYSNFDIWFTDEANYRPGYRTSSANAMSSATAACIGIFAQGLDQRSDVKVDLRDMIGAGGNTAWETNAEEDDDEDDTEEVA